MKKVQIDVYNQEVLIFESREDFNKWEKRNPIEEREIRHRELDFSEGMAGALITEDGDAFWFIYLQEKNLATLCHESLHVSYMMLDVLGVQHDVGNHEALAYLQDYIFGETCRLLKLPVLFE